jgi:hypothetical protein
VFPGYENTPYDQARNFAPYVAQLSLAVTLTCGGMDLRSATCGGVGTVRIAVSRLPSGSMVTAKEAAGDARGVTVALRIRQCAGGSTVHR